MTEDESEIKLLKLSIDNLLVETRTNYRIILVALAIMAAGKEILAIVK